MNVSKFVTGLINYYFVLFCYLDYKWFIYAHSKDYALISRHTNRLLGQQCSNTNTDNETDLCLPIDEVNLRHRPATLLQSLDPLVAYKNILDNLLFGYDIETDPNRFEIHHKLKKNETGKADDENIEDHTDLDHDLLQYPSGRSLRSELFKNKSAVHLPSPQYIHTGYSRLNITSDHLQTAVNAFYILQNGNLDDINALPPDYVLSSARTISMMKLPLEKLSMLWTVVKNGRKPSEIPHHVLEMYRPLFKYVNAREIARLDLLNERILSYVGTHAELGRHQMGVVASKYLKINPMWMKPMYLNLMNNIICGIPFNFMRRVPNKDFLQLTHQLFYHIRACQPLQRRFYLKIMTKTAVLGKSYSWGPRDVSRLGLLLTELQEDELSAINPEAMSGITPQVMLQIPKRKLQYFTEAQIRYLPAKPLNIFIKRLNLYQDQRRLNNGSILLTAPNLLFLMLTFLYHIMYRYPLHLISMRK